MGSRISIQLTDLLLEPKVRVTLFAEDEPVNDGEDTVVLGTVQHALVEFHSSREQVFVLDAHKHEGRVTLESDFNFFRQVGPGSYCHCLMQELFEFSVPFKVNH